MFFPTHPTRLDHLSGTDPFEIYRRMVNYDFGYEFYLGFFVAYYRNFTIPSIAKTLVASGEITARPLKRSYDTGIVLHEIIANGFDSDRGQAMVGLLRRVHKNVPGSSDDFLYVLMTLLVLPLRWVEAHGWRRLTEREKQSAVAFYVELGARMGLGRVPETFEEAGRFLDEYEDRWMGPSPEGATLMKGTSPALTGALPAPLQRHTPLVLALMMDKRQVALALGLKPAPTLLRYVFNGLLRVRALKARTTPMPTTPAFTPGRANPAVYPNGYALADVGPS
ncbi:oxygenase MpaB family protein (plasmid) [Pseudarthrobacter sp. P1]|uniref:oxygenase MpaB family protein n=1 Tax=Pseudarthrobacter sp. P1 TaxID=3418418 RepID=UPI003CFBB2B3